MVKVTIELWPLGFEENKRKLGEVIITNDGSGDLTVGSYDVTLSKEPPLAKTRGIWKRGRVEGFNRVSRGPYDLLYLALKACVESRNKNV